MQEAGHKSGLAQCDRHEGHQAGACSVFSMSAPYVILLWASTPSLQLEHTLLNKFKIQYRLRMDESWVGLHPPRHPTPAFCTAQPCWATGRDTHPNPYYTLKVKDAACRMQGRHAWDLGSGSRGIDSVSLHSFYIMIVSTAARSFLSDSWMGCLRPRAQQ